MSQGMTHVGNDECNVLNKCIFDLVQAERQYYDEATITLKNQDLLEATFIHVST